MPRSSRRTCLCAQVVSRPEPCRLFADKGETYKVEIIQSIPEGEEISLYQHGDSWTCPLGPHIERTGQIKAFQGALVRGCLLAWRRAQTPSSSASTAPPLPSRMT